MQSPEKVRLDEAFAAIGEHWRPRVVGRLNGQEVKVVKVQGKFVWHHHEEADEMFLVLDGRLAIEFRDHTVELGPGEMVVVPRGVEHRPVAAEEASVLLFETAGLRNTGNVVDERLTAPPGRPLE
jgi:mannose-6-phosphate isomerase-like protein (cupin superfamily)